MRQHPPATQTMTASEARQQFALAINRVAKDDARIVVEKNGVPVAAIIPTIDLKRLQKLDDEDRRAWEILEAMRKPFEGVPSEEIEEATERIMAEIKEENRRNRSRAAAGE
jgi:prevent-host-death family protein